MEIAFMNQKIDEDQDAPAFTWRRDACFGCGPSNHKGLQLKFALSPGGKSYMSEVSIGSSFAGPPGYAHGGIIATILDEAMGAANKLNSKVALTRRMEVVYMRLVPLGQSLIVEGRVSRISGRALYNRAELRNDKGEILARSRGKFLTIDAETMFSREELEEVRSKATKDPKGKTCSKRVKL
jgi:acyl-coenzyme A thioesterase PaaI-like protein